MTVPVEPKPEFRALSEPEVLAALGDADPRNRIACEVARLIEGYTAGFRQHVERLGAIPPAVPRLSPRWPIEDVAMRLATDAISDAIAAGRDKP